MEVPYIFAILNTIAVGVYVYAIHVFNFADRGVQYLSILSTKDTDKLNNIPEFLEALRKRDLPNSQRFASERNRVKSLIVTAIIINAVNYVFYPYLPFAM